MGSEMCIRDSGNGGSNTDRTTPGTVSSITSASSVSAGRYHTCALLSNGTIQCWGRSTRGQLGTGNTTELKAPGKSVIGISTAVVVSSGREHTCAVLLNGEVFCWGSGGDGRLGNDSTDHQSSPVKASGISTAVAIGTGDKHSCAVLSGGSMQCWGDDGDGRLGNGSGGGSETPTSVSGISTGRAVTAGNKHSCVVSDNGRVRCWGDDQFGQLGNDSSKSSDAQTSQRTIIVTSGLELTGSVVNQAVDLNEFYIFTPSLKGVADSWATTNRPSWARFNTAIGVLYGVPSEPADHSNICLLYTSPSPRDRTRSRMPSSA